ncbi:hypothetical protein [Xanthobacter versatilis]|uniref:hypothetical protein n=1 Tax=Xanthobacter autotrophicus (strain ATCC BAA-1158 / Py2) TaxID=78245 RepID=UPI00372C5EAC
MENLRVLIWLLFPVVLMLVFWRDAMRLMRAGHGVAAVLTVLGALGFFGGFLLPNLGSLLDPVELPAFFFTTTIAGPDHSMFSLTGAFARVQRYDMDGTFRNGWFAQTGGNSGAIGLTTEGWIAVASTETKQIELFHPDGSPAAPPRPFSWTGTHEPRVLWPSSVRVEGVTLAQPVELANPPLHALPALLVPFWDPLVAWLMIGAAVLLTRFGRRQPAQGVGPPRA